MFKKIFNNLRKSPINFFSDLFIVTMVLLWIADNIYESIIASVVTISSIILSFQTGVVSIDTSMWSAIGSNIGAPLIAGGGIWMIKNGVQHALMNSKGKECPHDFPAIEDTEITHEQEINEDED